MNNTKSREKNYDRGLRIAERRKQLGLSQDELAHRIGIGRQALSSDIHRMSMMMDILPPRYIPK